MIPKEDYNLVPYKGNETLVFRSNGGNFDTVFLQGKERFFSPIHQWSFPIKECEHYSIISKRSDPVFGRSQRYLDSLNLITLVNDGVTRIEIEFTAKNAWLYGNEIFTKDQFLHLPDTSAEINGKRYKDILIIKPNMSVKDNKNGQWVERINTITKLYWSKSSGVVCYDVLSGEKWELFPAAVRRL